MTIPRLDPQHLIPRDSINRVTIARLPYETAEKADVEGKTAYQMLSSEALAERIRESFDKLGLAGTSPGDSGTLIRLFDGCFHSSDITTRDEAREIASWFGRRLGYLLLTLKRGDPANREAHPEWDSSRWEHWARIRTIILGGGIMSGKLGTIAVASARRVLEHGGISDCKMRVSEYAGILPLIGAARMVSLSGGVTPVFDLGGTFAKRGHATHKEGQLSTLRLLASMPARPFQLERSEKEPDAEAHDQADYILKVIQSTWDELRRAGLDPRPQIVLAVASYVENGQPGDMRGSFGLLRRLSSDVPGWFSNQLQSSIKENVDITFQHDGTAAALTYAGMSGTAVIMVGTALGFGFPPDEVAHSIQPLASDFRVIEL